MEKTHTIEDSIAEIKAMRKYDEKVAKNKKKLDKIDSFTWWLAKTEDERKEIIKDVEQIYP